VQFNAAGPSPSGGGAYIECNGMLNPSGTTTIDNNDPDQVVNECI